MGVGIDGLVGVQTLQSADVLVGTDEVDELHAVLNGTGAGGSYAAPSITDIEEFYFTAEDGIISDAGLNLLNASGYTELWNMNSGYDLTLENIQDMATIGMDGVRGGTEYRLEFTSSADTSVVNVIANAVGTSAATGPAELDIHTAQGPNFSDMTLGVMNLEVSNTVRLDLEHAAAQMSDLNISGSGPLFLTANANATYGENFINLETLDSTGYIGDLTLDVSGSDVLTSVETGGGDDWINIDMANANGGLSVDLGGGADTLSLESAGSPTDENDINGLNFTGGVAGVEVLAFANPLDLGGNATLNMDGISADLETLDFTDGIDGDGNKLTLAESPVGDLTIDALAIEDLKLDTGNVVNLDINTSEGLDITPTTPEMGGLFGDDLETLVLNQVGDGDLSLVAGSGVDNLNALTSIEAKASNDGDDTNAAGATVEITDANGSLTDGLVSLETVKVTADDNAELTMTGSNDALSDAQDTLNDAISDRNAAEAARDAADEAINDPGGFQEQLDAAQTAVGTANQAVGLAEHAHDDAQAVVYGVGGDATNPAAGSLADNLAAAQDDLDAAIADVAAGTTLVGDFTYDAVTGNIIDETIADAANRAAADAHIDTLWTDFTAAQRADLKALIPAPSFSPSFNSQAEYDAFLSDVEAYMEGVYNISGLEATLAAAEDALYGVGGDATNPDPNSPMGELAAAEAALTSAKEVLTGDPLDPNDEGALGALAEAQQDLTGAQITLANAETALVDAEAEVLIAQQARDDAGPDGMGFEALTTVDVAAKGDAEVTLTDVYGLSDPDSSAGFDLDVKAEDNTTVTLTDTGVVNAKVAGGLEASDLVKITITGFDDTTYGNQDLVSLTVEGANADVTLAENLAEFSTLDVSDVDTTLTVKAGDADYGARTQADAVEYLIGDTGTVNITAESAQQAREVFKFTEGDIGDVTIKNFDDGNSAVAERDIIDLSGITGITDATDIAINADGSGDMVITAAGNQFDGSITLEGVAWTQTDADSLEAFNVQYT